MIKDLEQLRAFVQIARTGSMTAAAGALGQRVNTVSRRLAALENQIGHVLFVRSTRRMDITEAGRKLYGHARDILAAVSRAEDDLRPSEQLGGRVRVSLGTANADLALLRSLSALMREHPALSVEVHVTDDPVEVFAQGFDLAIHVGPLVDSRLVAVRLADAYGWLAAAPSYVATFGQPSHPRDLVHHECLRFRSPSRQQVWPLVDARGRRVDAPVSGRFESNNSRFLYEAMLAGLGIGLGFLPDHERAIERGELVRVLPKIRFGPLPISALMPASVSRLRAVRAVLEVVKARLADTT